MEDEGKVWGKKCMSLCIAGGEITSEILYRTVPQIRASARLPRLIICSTPPSSSSSSGVSPSFGLDRVAFVSVFEGSHLCQNQSQMSTNFGLPIYDMYISNLPFSFVYRIVLILFVGVVRETRDASSHCVACSARDADVYSCLF